MPSAAGCIVALEPGQKCKDFLGLVDPPLHVYEHDLGVVLLVQSVLYLAGDGHQFLKDRADQRDHLQNFTHDVHPGTDA